MMLTNSIQAIAGCCKTVHSSLINVMLGIRFDEKVSLIGYSIPLLSGEKWIGKSSVQSVEICDKLLVRSAIAYPWRMLSFTDNPIRSLQQRLDFLRDSCVALVCARSGE